MPSPVRVLVAVVGLSVLPAALTGQAGEGASSADPPLFETLGDYHRWISTDVPGAQAYFDQGMRLMYAYHTGLALESFVAAREHDPECAMCFWGEAWALSPYLNGGMGPDDEERAARAMERAASLADEGATEAERALIEAFEARFDADPDPETRPRRDSAYARAMAVAARHHPRDHDIQTLRAEAMLLLRPRYEMRDLSSPDVRAIRRVLERVLERDLGHPGACHLYIHLMEMTDEPEAAEPCADRLADRIPGASHILHMPSHIYMRTGRYDDAVRSNIEAWNADQRGREGGAVPIYPTHNLEMLVYAANFGGQGAVAVDAAQRLAAEQPSSAILVPTSLALFGRWDRILAEDAPTDGSFVEGGWRFARGMALLRTGDAAAARDELDRLRRLSGDVPAGRYRGASHRTILSVARDVLGGEIALAEGRTDEAVRTLREAVETEDGFAYSEPEPWHLPARRFLGAALLEAGRAEAAERVYREALEDHTDEGWSLVGLENALRAQDRPREADRVRRRFEEVWERGDVWLDSSRL